MIRVVKFKRLLLACTFITQSNAVTSYVIEDLKWLNYMVKNVSLVKSWRGFKPHKLSPKQATGRWPLLTIIVAAFCLAATLHLNV